jgi:DNA-binding beta-propeller fold protein YncE
MGYVVCPNAVTPVELATDVAEPAIPLPVSGTPDLGNFAIATSPNGAWAYVVTTDGESRPASGADTTSDRLSAGKQVGPSGVDMQNVVIPIDLVTQEAEPPIKIPGQGGTHAIVVLPGSGTVLAASGSTIVPVDPTTRQVGAPLDLGAGNTIFGMALDPSGGMLDALVAGAVFAVDTANATAHAPIATGLSVSSVYSPHGIVINASGATLYVVGQGGTDFGGRVLPIVAASGATMPMSGFDQFGISDPAAVAIDPTGSELLVADSANNWIIPVSLDNFADPDQPVRLPELAGAAGTGHPTDVVFGPGSTGAFVVDGFSTVIPFRPGSRSFGRPIRVCSGASSMAVAPSP